MQLQKAERLRGEQSQQTSEGPILWLPVPLGGCQQDSHVAQASSWALLPEAPSKSERFHLLRKQDNGICGLECAGRLKNSAEVRAQAPGQITRKW